MTELTNPLEVASDADYVLLIIDKRHDYVPEVKAHNERLRLIASRLTQLASKPDARDRFIGALRHVAALQPDPLLSIDSVMAMYDYVQGASTAIVPAAPQPDAPSVREALVEIHRIATDGGAVNKSRLAVLCQRALASSTLPDRDAPRNGTVEFNAEGLMELVRKLVVDSVPEPDQSTHHWLLKIKQYARALSGTGAQPIAEPEAWAVEVLGGVELFNYESDAWAACTGGQKPYPLYAAPAQQGEQP